MKTRPLSALVRSLVFASLSMSLIAGCATTATTSSQPMANDAIAQAKAAIARGNAVNWLWRDTEQLVRDAEAAAAEGDTRTANALATEARLQAELALAQYNDERTMKRDLIK